LNLVENRFRHPQPEDIREHNRIFGVPILFEQPEDELVLERKFLD
jgi:hypothetical protein